MPPTPDFLRVPSVPVRRPSAPENKPSEEKAPQQKSRPEERAEFSLSSLFSGLTGGGKITDLIKEGDTKIIAAILLLLWGETDDKLLIFALIYILL